MLLAFWRPSPAGWLAITAGYMGGLMDTFLQNPLGNPLANNPLLEWFPSFGPMQFAAGGAFGHTWLTGHLVLGLAWAAAFALTGLIIFRIRTRSHPAEG